MIIILMILSITIIPVKPPGSAPASRGPISRVRGSLWLLLLLWSLLLLTLCYYNCYYYYYYYDYY